MRQRQLPPLPPTIASGSASARRGDLEVLIGERRTRTLIARRVLVAVVPGHYAIATHAESLLVRAHAATSATSGVLTGSAALFALGALDRAPSRVRVVAPHGARIPRAPWLSGSRRREVTADGLWVATPFAEATQAALDAWTDPTNRDRQGDLLGALTCGVVTSASLERLLDGTARVRDRRGLMALIADYRAGAHSALEQIGLRQTFVGAEFARFVRQHTVRAGTRRYRLDMYDPLTRTAVELDGAKYHAAGSQRERDIRRDADLAAIGILTIRFSYRDVVGDPERCREIVRAVLGQREPL